MSKLVSRGTLRDAALAYAARGWPVFPLKPRGKTPLTAHGLHDATTDARQIGAWWTHWPAANIGLDCGRAGLVVIDVDADTGGLDTWAMLDPHVPTLTSQTGGGGYHFFYALPAGQKPLRNSTGRLGPGVDVRAAGGYIVVPPSVHASGHRYTWQGPEPEKNGARPVAPLPASLLARLRPAPRAQAYVVPDRSTTPGVDVQILYAEAALDAEAERVRMAVEGTRNDTLNRAAFALGQIAGAGVLGRAEVEAALLPASIAAGLDELEARRTLASGFEAGMREPRVIPPLRAGERHWREGAPARTGRRRAANFLNS